MNELQVQSVWVESPPARRPWHGAARWFLSTALAALLGLGGGWTAWAWQQAQNAPRLEDQRKRQDEAMNEVLRQLAAVRAELAAQKPERLEPEPDPEPVSPPWPGVLREPRTLAPPAAGSVRAQFRTGDIKPEKKEKRGVMKFLTSSIVVDSAVLASSLLVPPSLPLTLAQSRLGRRLTGRIFKKTKTDKTVAAKIVRDVEDMPITQRRRR